MEKLCVQIQEFISYLKPLLPIANSHTVHFLTTNTWERVVPDVIKSEFESIGYKQLISKFWLEKDVNCPQLELSKFVSTSLEMVINETEFCLSLKDLKEKLNVLNCNNDTKINLNSFMSYKKKHEVELLSAIVAQISKLTGSNHIIDIGSGKGYLTSILALQHELQVLGIDNKQTNIHGAAKRSENLEKHWRVIKEQSENSSSYKKRGKHWKSKNINNTNSVKEKLDSYDEYYDKYKWKSKVLGSRYKQKIQDITPDTDLRSVIESVYPNPSDNWLLVGLHTCGNLSPSCIKHFVNNDILKTIVNVGCCYHLLDEEYCKDIFWNDIYDTLNPSDTYGFPLSSFLRDQEFYLGRDARMCAAQIPDKVFKERNMTKYTTPLFYRALLQVYLSRKFSTDDYRNGVVGRLATKCSTFSEYVHKALQRLHIEIKVDENELSALQKEFATHFEYLQIYFLMKTSLSGVIESVILMDRLLYLYEQGVEEAFVAQIFDPVLSPRCYAVIASKNKYNIISNDL